VPENNVTISIKTLQRREDGSELVTQRAEGLLARQAGAWVLTWREGEENGLGETRTTLRLEEDRAILTRTGETASRMVFQVGRSHELSYRTPYGSLPMTVHTLRLDREQTKAGGRVTIIYKLRLGEDEVVENRLRLTVRERERT